MPRRRRRRRLLVVGFLRLRRAEAHVAPLLSVLDLLVRRELRAVAVEDRLDLDEGGPLAAGPLAGKPLGGDGGADGQAEGAWDAVLADGALRRRHHHRTLVVRVHTDHILLAARVVVDGVHDVVKVSVHGAERVVGAARLGDAAYGEARRRLARLHAAMPRRRVLAIPPDRQVYQAHAEQHAPG